MKHVQAMVIGLHMLNGTLSSIFGVFHVDGGLLGKKNLRMLANSIFKFTQFNVDMA